MKNRKSVWDDRGLLQLCGLSIPIIQAPMAGANLSRLAAAVSTTGGLGSLPCGMLSTEQIRREVAGLRDTTSNPFNLNFFCHTPPEMDRAAIDAWLARLRPYYEESSLLADPDAIQDSRIPFNRDACRLVAELKPGVVSFHYGLPAEDLLASVKKIGCRVLSTATTVEEAVWLEAMGVDAVIAQGWEAGGHRGMFLSDQLDSQIGTLALVPQVLDAVKVPVVAAGGIGDARGIAACLAMGASAVQLGTAYLQCPESTISSVYRSALRNAAVTGTCVTNVLTGRPARGLRNRIIDDLGPISDEVLPFPLASAAIAPLRGPAERKGLSDFSPLWAGQYVPGTSGIPAGELTTKLASEAFELLG